MKNQNQTGLKNFEANINKNYILNTPTTFAGKYC